MEATQSPTQACSAEMHVDGNNRGSSYITALGDGEGGGHTRGEIYREAYTLAALQLSHRLGLDDCVASSCTQVQQVATGSHQRCRAENLLWFVLESDKVTTWVASWLAFAPYAFA